MSEDKGAIYYERSVKDGKYNKKTDKYEEKEGYGGGILFAPGIRIKLNKFIIGVNFDLGWAYIGGSGFYKDVQLSLGYNF